MVPVAALPPATPFTSHVTAVFDAPVTVALKAWLAPARTLVGFGETVTLMVAGLDPPPELPGVLDPCPVKIPVQAAWEQTANEQRGRDGKLAQAQVIRVPMDTPLRCG